MMRTLLRWYFIRKYGLHNRLPPVPGITWGTSTKHPMWYIEWKRFCWNVESCLYDYSDLPHLWQNWFTSSAIPQSKTGTPLKESPKSPPEGQDTRNPSGGN
jgi:hypothetical protein